MILCVRFLRPSETGRGGTAAIDPKRTLRVADVVGYSRLMGEDEAGTLAALQAHRRELIDRSIEEHDGRLVKLTGDGALVESASIVQATECAVAIQRAMAVRNEEVPADRRIEFRIGLNLGDIIIEDDDIYAAWPDESRLSG